MQSPTESPAGLVFTAHNRHVPGCGAPPAIVKDGTGAYHGYFENAYGEQWVLVFDPKSKTGTLRGGDLGWDRQIPITAEGIPGTIILNRAENVWLAACLTACGVELDDEDDDFDEEDTDDDFDPELN